MRRWIVASLLSLPLALGACGSDRGPVEPPRPTGPGATVATGEEVDAPAAVVLEPLPAQGVVIGRAHGVAFVDLGGEVVDRLAGFSLYHDWTVPGPVILRSHRVYYALDVREHLLRPIGSRRQAAGSAPQFQAGVDPSRERFELVDEPLHVGAPDTSGFWAFALPSPDGTMLLAQWSGECEVQTAFLAGIEGSDPRPITGQRGLVGTPASKALGWTTDGGALVFLGPGGPCGSSSDPAGVYRFGSAGRGRMLIPVPDPHGVRMWGTA
jgi:hypothetical protein